jgi:predicted PurR-regulated permease PerM
MRLDMASLPDSEKKIPEIPLAWLALATIVILIIVGLFALILFNPQVLMILFAGLFLGIAIKPAVSGLAQRGIPREVGAALILISILILLGGFIAFAFPMLSVQTANLSTTLSDGYIQIRSDLISVSNPHIRQIMETLPEDIRLFQPALTQPRADNGLDGLGNLLEQIFGVGLGLVFVFFLAVNWSIEGDRILRTALLLINQQREYIRDLFFHVENRISQYLRGLGVLSLIVGALALIGYLIIGLPNALALAIFAGIMEAIPVIGPALGAVPAIMIALSISPEMAIAVVVITVLIQAAENVWIFPRVMGSSVGVPPFVTLLTMLAFSSLFGIFGALVAIPIAAVLQVLFETVAEYRLQQSVVDMGRDRVSALRYEIQELIKDIRNLLHTKNPQAHDDLELLEDTLEGIASDLDKILQESTAGKQI